MAKKLIRSTLILALIIFVTFVFSREVSHLHFLKKENRKIIDRIETLKIQNKDYEEKIEALKNNDKFIEKTIRDELGMIKEGEKVYRFNN